MESFASGGVLGKGLGNGVISKNLPDAHSDFIFALIGEEFGYITSIFIICLFLVIHLRIYLLIKITNNFFIINSLTGLGNVLFFKQL